MKRFRNCLEDNKMREMKDSGIEWVGKIPSNWSVMQNKYVMKKQKHICTKYTGQNILSLTMDGVIVRDLNGGGKMPATFDGYQYITKGNLLMCLFDYDVTPRCIGLINYDGLTSPAYSQFTLMNGNIPKYYFYYYLMIDHTKALLHLAKNLRHSFTEDQLGNILTPVPPFSEQQKIADFLDKKCSQIDALRANIEKQIKILEEYKKSIITEAVTKGLDTNVEMKDSGIEWIGEVPKDWSIMQNKYVMKKKKNICLQYEGQDILSLTMNGVIVRDLNAGGKMPSSFDGYQYIEKGNLLMCLFDYDVTPRCIGLIENNGITSPAYSQFILLHGNISRYYYYYYLMIDNTKAILHLAKNLRHSFTEEQLGNLLTPVPSVTEQQRIADYLDKKCFQIDSIIRLKNLQLESLESYKKSLIYEYVTGKKEVI